MSYDLVVFDPLAPPPTRDGFLAWYRGQTQWKEGHSYDNPDVATPNLRVWFLEMLEEYPAMNGPYASDDVDNSKLTDYCVGETLVYAAFSWSEAEGALKFTFRLAVKHGVGFFNVSADNGGVWVPDQAGNYLCIHGVENG